ncbi:DUF1800 family protein [Pedobacter sp. HMF7056]|uniref:DUF1800 family protein n=2 Tax=Hufsiella ginkgonis TaxID=2695274 RepID=A0A7K1XVA9_9SPHI|nr:DUF1800 family protein [Hufsiella ginkgonis]
MPDRVKNSVKLKHLYARAGFGITPADLKNQEHWPVGKTVRSLFESSERFSPITVVNENTDLVYNGQPMMAANVNMTGGMTGSSGGMMASQADAMRSEETKRLIQETRNRQERDLNIAWMTLMSTTQAQLREKMTLFWHNHFSCRVGNFMYMQDLNNIHRKHALGNFKTMLTEVAQTPAMLQFLNNQSNNKVHPNENFARELMELFTIGRGNYTEQDVRESARAFTGWQYDGKTYQYSFREKSHDDGTKTFFGKTGNWRGEDIINMILERKETAQFLSRKLYRYLVNDVPDEVHIREMADVLYRSGYEIKPWLEKVLTAGWFYEPQNIGNLVKSPVEFLVGLNRQFYITYENPGVLIQFQRTLGQVLFNPPNVAGWPGGRNWIDSSSLMHRLKMPSLILNAGLIEFAGKATPEEEAYIAAMRKQQDSVIKRVQAKADINKFIAGLPPKTSKEEIAGFMLEPPVNPSMLAEAANSPDIKTLLIRLTSTPEYQLC